MNFKKFFQKIVETKENHPEKILKTHYFSAPYPKVKEAFLTIAREKGYDVKDFNDRYKEAFLETHNHYVIATFMDVTPFETSVDLKIGMYALLGLGRPHTLVSQWYGALSKHVMFKGVGPHD